MVPKTEDNKDITKESDNTAEESVSSVDQSSVLSTTAPILKQDALKSDISVLEAELNATVKKRHAGLGKDGIEKQIKKIRHDTNVKKKTLKNKIVRAAKFVKI